MMVVMTIVTSDVHGAQRRVFFLAIISSELYLHLSETQTIITGQVMISESLIDEPPQFLVINPLELSMKSCNRIT